MKTDLYSQSGEKKGQIELSKEIFEIPFNKDLVHQALVMQLANARQVSAHTKTKGEVSGRNMKPYKQKHTGNARQGSLRNPHMRGGGVAFGPNSDRNFTKGMPKKQRRKALVCALSAKAKENLVVVLEKYEGEPKTKTLATLLSKLPIKRDTLIVIPAKEKNFELAARNLSNAKVTLAGYVNIQDLQKSDTVLFTKQALEKLEETFLKKA
jgi:large subunit ribosomal protein L4